MNEDRKLILAFVLCAAIIFGYGYFQNGKIADAPKTTEKAITLEEKKENTPPAVKEPVERDVAIKGSKRIYLKNDDLQVSVNLEGAAIDDVVLQKYHQTIQPGSKNITLLNPDLTDNPYFAEMGWVSHESSVDLPKSNSVWSVQSQNDRSVKLTWKNSQGAIFERDITLDEHQVLSVKDSVINTHGQTMDLFPYATLVRKGAPKSGGMALPHEGIVGVIEGGLKEYDYKKVQDKKIIENNSDGGWVGITDQYWLTAWLYESGKKMISKARYVPKEGVDQYRVETIGEKTTVKTGETISYERHLFTGPKIVALLDDYEKKFNISHLDQAVDFGWFYFLTKPMFFLLMWLYKALGNLGVSILAMTLLIRMVMYPVANRQFKAMSRMKEIQPMIEKVRQLHGQDKMRMNQEMMELYRREKVNPVSGCLPALIQFPVGFAIYKVLSISIEMRHAPFFGWIHDLSAPDPTSFINLFGLLPFEAPSFLAIGVWPLLMGITMVLQQRMSPPPSDPAQAKVMMFMPIIFTYMLSQFSSGLVIYWTWYNLLSIVQQYAITNVFNKKPDIKVVKK